MRSRHNFVMLEHTSCDHRQSSFVAFFMHKNGVFLWHAIRIRVAYVSVSFHSCIYLLRFYMAVYSVHTHTHHLTHQEVKIYYTYKYKSSHNILNKVEPFSFHYVRSYVCILCCSPVSSLRALRFSVIYYFYIPCLYVFCGIFLLS